MRYVSQLLPEFRVLNGRMIGKRAIGALFVLAALGSAGALSQSSTRVQGTIHSVEEARMTIGNPAGQQVRVLLNAQTRIVYNKPLKLSDLQPGTALGTTAVRLADGRLLAREVHVFPGVRTAPNEGNSPMSVEPNASMTNAVVSATLESANGRELTLSYKGGSQQVIVPGDVPVFELSPADRSVLVPGRHVAVSAVAGSGGELSATRVQVSEGDLRLPR